MHDMTMAVRREVTASAQPTLVAIVVIVSGVKAEPVVEAARSAGATGSTMLFGRGTGTQQNVAFHSIRGVILILADSSRAGQILNAVTEAGDLGRPDSGVAFVVPIQAFVGQEHGSGGGAE